MLHNVLPHGILGGSPAHEEHHNGGKRHYQQFFLYLDWAIGASSADEEVTEKKTERVTTSLKRGNSFTRAHTMPPVMPVN